MYDFTDKSTMGGLCVVSQNIADDDDGKSTISSCDIASLYPSIMMKKLPITDYKWVTNFDIDRYGQSKLFGCLINCEINTTQKVRDHPILKQFPVLISKTNIKYDDLSEFQRKNLKSNYISSEKLVSHLGYDNNSFFSFEMYQMLLSLGYRINIKKY